MSGKDQVLEAGLKLTLDERRSVAEALLESVEDRRALTEDELKEIRRRFEKMEKYPETNIPWPLAYQKLKAK